MAVPPLIENLFSLLKGIFTGTVGLTFLVILTLFITKIIWDFIFDLFLKNVKKYLDILFLPGSFFHKLNAWIQGQGQFPHEFYAGRR
ncbi:MAG: hypothetical protein ACTSP3_16605 [Candidatus Heimdallarchaeaceae archaeon]